MQPESDQPEFQPDGPVAQRVMAEKSPAQLLAEAQQEQQGLEALQLQGVFQVGQEVSLPNDQGQIEAGWRVEAITAATGNQPETVRVTRNGVTLEVTRDYLMTVVRLDPTAASQLEAQPPPPASSD
ncbi:MAG TPA: hypothetical protein VLF67_01920 [Candidatus Saccharimonas sp.]|nr:hypothetical protein [Candidatus Saccharimonas sp.]